MRKKAGHVEDRAKQRTNFSSKEIAAARELVARRKLKKGATYHIKYPGRGSFIVGDVGKDKPRHVVKTVYGPRMKAPGKSLSVNTPKRLYHGSPFRGLRTLNPKAPRGHTAYEKQRAVFMTDDPNSAALYALARDKKRENKGWAAIGGRLQLGPNAKLNKRGYIYHTDSDNYLTPPRGQENSGFAVPTKVKVKGMKEVTPAEYEHLIDRFDTKEAFRRHVNSLIEKTANDRVRHYLVTGHSGAGKSTLARKLSEETGAPIVALDDAPSIKAILQEQKDLARAHPEGKLKLTPELNKKYEAVELKAIQDAIAAKNPSIIEGSYFLKHKPDMFKGHKMMLVDRDRDTILDQRVERKRLKDIKRGREWSDDIAKGVRTRGGQLLDYYQPGVDTWRSSSLVEKKASNPRIPRKPGQPANSKKHSDLFTDENPKGTIHGLGFKTPAHAHKSVSKIKGSGKTHAHKTQAAIAMEQRAKSMGKTEAASVYRSFIEEQKQKTKEKNASSDILLPPPPSEAERTKELDAVQKQRANYIPNKDRDADLDDIFILFANLLGIKRKEVEKIGDRLVPIIKRHKDHYNLERPHQLAARLGVPFDHEFDKVKSAHTPSYPSGHSCQGHYLALFFSDLYPKKKKQLMALSKEITKARIDRGLHYPSDCKAGVDLAEKLYKIDKETAHEKTARKLTTKGRNQISEGNFALPGRRYPIHDIAHGRNALARVAQHGTEEEKRRVRKAVSDKYPSIEKTATTGMQWFRATEKTASFVEALSTYKEARAPRNYEREYSQYHSKPQRIQERSQRNKARRKLGLKKGDPREVDHKNPISNGGTNRMSNLRTTSLIENRKKFTKTAFLLPGFTRSALMSSAKKLDARVHGPVAKTKPLPSNMVYSPKLNMYVDPSKPKDGVWMFHGTSPAAAKKIAKTGLQPKKALEHNLSYGDLDVTDAEAVKNRKAKARTKKQKQSVHLTPHLRYAANYGLFTVDGQRIPRGQHANVVATYLSNEDLAKKVTPHAKELSGARGYYIHGDAFLHEGTVDKKKVQILQLGHDFEIPKIMSDAKLLSETGFLNKKPHEYTYKELTKAAPVLHDWKSKEGRAYLDSKVKKAPVAKTASVREKILDAFKAEGGALGMKALKKHVTDVDVTTTLKELMEEGRVYKHRHGDLIEKKAGTATKTNPSLWEKSKQQAKARMGGKHSARAMQLATQIYKKKGGGYSGAKPTSKNNSLKKWGKQKWGYSGKDKPGQGGSGVYLPKAKRDRLKSTKAGRKELASASRKKAIATKAGVQYSSHGLAAGTSLKKTANYIRDSIDQLKEDRKKGKLKDRAGVVVGVGKGGGIGGSYALDKDRRLSAQGTVSLSDGVNIGTSYRLLPGKGFSPTIGFGLSGPTFGVSYRREAHEGEKTTGEQVKDKVQKTKDSLKKKFSKTAQMVKEGSVEYRGTTFPGYNKPIASNKKGKKKMVLVKRGDKIKLVHFGQDGYSHNYSKKAKKNYLTRSAGIRNKDGKLTKNDPFSPNYWARKVLWPKRQKADGSSLKKTANSGMLWEHAKEASMVRNFKNALKEYKALQPKHVPGPLAKKTTPTPKV